MNRVSGSKRPTAKEQAWHDWLRSKGCAACGAAAAIHHCAGSTAKHRKIHIGQAWVIPLCYDCHQGPDGIHANMQALTQLGFEGTRKQIEKRIFREHVATYHRQKGELPLAADVIAAIEDYRR